jgi:hypothetical protein
MKMIVIFESLLNRLQCMEPHHSKTVGPSLKDVHRVWTRDACIKVLEYCKQISLSLACERDTHAKILLLFP